MTDNKKETVYLDIEEVLGKGVAVNVDTTRKTKEPDCGSMFKDIKSRSKETHGKISTIEPTKKYSLEKKERTIIND